MKRKIRHALVHYTVEVDGRTLYETAFRNQIVDIPDDQVERLDELGATVAPDSELERPGTMSALPETASNAEITNWVIGATNEEVEALVRARPVMAARIESAHASIAERFNEQNLHLGGLREIADEAEAQAQAEADAAALAGMSEGDLEVLSELEGLSDEEVAALAELAAADAAAKAQAEAADLIGDSFDPDKIVSGTAKDAADYISENPQHAEAILEAEGRRAEAAKEDPRVTIVRAAEAAAGFSAQ